MKKMKWDYIYSDEFFYEFIQKEKDVLTALPVMRPLSRGERLAILWVNRYLIGNDEFPYPLSIMAIHYPANQEKEYPEEFYIRSKDDDNMLWEWP